jgi:hypothetical protein
MTEYTSGEWPTSITGDGFEARRLQAWDNIDNGLDELENSYQPGCDPIIQAAVNVLVDNILKQYETAADDLVVEKALDLFNDQTINNYHRHGLNTEVAISLARQGRMTAALSIASPCEKHILRDHESLVYLAIAEGYAYYDIDVVAAQYFIDRAFATTNGGFTEVHLDYVNRAEQAKNEAGSETNKKVRELKLLSGVYS